MRMSRRRRKGRISALFINGWEGRRCRIWISLSVGLSIRSSRIGDLLMRRDGKGDCGRSCLGLQWLCGTVTENPFFLGLAVRTLLSFGTEKTYITSANLGCFHSVYNADLVIVYMPFRTNKNAPPECKPWYHLRGNTPPQRPDRPGSAGSAAPPCANHSPAPRRRH